MYIKSKFDGLWVREDNEGPDNGALQESYGDDAYKIDQLNDVKVALDIGAHVGGASKRLHERFPDAIIIAVEACPDNIECLKRNVGAFAKVIHAACTYEEDDLVLASTVYPNCRTTGSSVVTTRKQWLEETVHWTWYVDDYHLDDRPMPKITIEEIMQQFSLDYIDFMKLDCEGSEVSILKNCKCLDKIGKIIGEYHNKDFNFPGVELWNDHLFAISRNLS